MCTMKALPWVLQFNRTFATKSFPQALSSIHYNAESIKHKVPADQDTKRKEARLAKKLIVTELEEMFHIQRHEAITLTTKCKNLSILNKKLLTTNYAICKKYKLSDALILSCPQLLAQKDLETKVFLLKDLEYPINVTYQFLHLQVNALELLVKKLKAEYCIYPEGRIKYLADLFNKSEEFVCERMTKIKFLQTIQLEKIKKSYELILSFGLTNDDINKDLWALGYNIDTIEQRLNFAKEMNLDKIKLWMIRAQPRIFDKYIERIKDNEKILGNHSLIEYLSAKLDCSANQVNLMLEKLPALENKSLKKLQEIIDFLYTKGFKPVHVYRVPKILLHSMDTMKKRLSELEKENIKLDSLYMLTKSQKQYKQYYEALIRNKKTQT